VGGTRNPLPEEVWSWKEIHPRLFEGLAIPENIDQIAVFLLASKQTYQTIGGGRIVLVSELLEEIFRDLKTKDLAKSAIDEQKPLLRTLQFAVAFRNILARV
jgi:hypothetical protein